MPDALLSWAVGAFAWWTVLFHVAMALRWHRDLVAGLWLAGLLVVAVARVGLGRLGRPVSLQLRLVRPGSPGRLVVIVGGTLSAFALSATRWPEERPAWWVFWAAVVVLSTWALATILRTPLAGPPSPGDATARAVTGGALALVLAVGVVAAIGSAVTQRPDADDVFLVNRSTWVAEHPGPLPRRDTVFSDGVYAITGVDAVPTAIEPLVGVVAAWTSVSAPTLTYLVLGPAVAALSVLALWRLLRTLGATAPALAVAAAAAFLLLDGSTHASFGNFGFVRSWQGKAMFLTVIVPTLWHHSLRWTRDRSRRDLVLLATANLAAIGLSTTAVFIAPTVTVLGALAGAMGTGAWRRLWPALGTTAPLLAAAAVFAMVPSQDPIPGVAMPEPSLSRITGGIEPGDLWHLVFADGVGLVIAAGAAGISWIAVRDRSARLALVLPPLALFGIFYAPEALDSIDRVTGIGVILWRVAWILPVPAAVGLVLTCPLGLPRPRWQRATLAGLLTASMVVALTVGSTWVLAPDGGTQGVAVGWPAWDVRTADRIAAERLIEISSPGELVAAPELVGGAIAVQTTRVRAANPRTFYTEAPERRVAGFNADQRLLLTRAVTSGIDASELDALQAALRDLRVSAACTAPAATSSTALQAALEAAGLERVGSDAQCAYWDTVASR